MNKPAFLGTTAKRLLIGNRWVDAVSGRSFECTDPSNGEVLAHVADGDAADIDFAVASARRAFEGPWRREKPRERQHLLLKLADLVDKHAEELALLDTLDMGAPISRTRGVVVRMAAMLRFYAGMATAIHGDTIENSAPGEVISYTLKEPMGVVGAIIPWNGPLGSAIMKVAPAIAAGCTVVLKPAEEAPLSPLRFGELALEAGLPEGVLNIVTGGEAAGAALTRHLDVDKITFTGSHVTGQKIIQASAGNVKQLTLELGGKSPNIVFADADLEAAVPGAANAVFNNTGQVCSAGTRLFVEQSIYETFVERVAEYGRGLRVGPGIDPATQIGPLVSQQQLDRVLGYLDAGRREGARPISGGARLTDNAHSRGYFVPPTVFTDVRDDMKIAREEIFGPVLSAFAFKDEAEVIARANATPFGLGAGLWTREIGRAHRISRAIRTGSVWVNCYQMRDNAVPFGGYKMSGYGREPGIHHVDEYMHVKAVWMNTV